MGKTPVSKDHNNRYLNSVFFTFGQPVSYNILLSSFSQTILEYLVIFHWTPSNMRNQLSGLVSRGPELCL